MKRIYCKDCKFDKTIIETKRSSEGLETTYFCDPKGIVKRGMMTDAEKTELLVSIDQNRNSRCEYYAPKWHIRLFRFFRKFWNRP